MAPSGSKISSICGEELTAEGDSKASSICGTREDAEEGSESFSLPAEEGTSAEQEFLEDRDSTTCSAPKSKRARQAVSEASSSSEKLDAGMWSMLDDHILEKIFSRLPFKCLFQVPSLSKAWRLRFSSLSFQNEVYGSSSASSWNSYAPLMVNSKMELLGYEGGSKQWHRLPSHSYLLQHVGHSWNNSWSNSWKLRASAGSLLCWVCPDLNDWNGPNLNVFNIHVTNPLTRSWKQLTPRPEMHFPEIVHVGWEGGSSRAYKVIVGELENRTTLNGRASICVQIFDSTDDSWRTESYKIRTNCALRWGGSIFINGVLSMLFLTLERRAGYVLVSFDVKEKIWKEIPYLCLVVDDEDQKRHQLLTLSEVKFSQVFVSGAIVMLVVFCIDELSNEGFDTETINDVHEEKTVSLFRLDLERGLAFEVVSRAPDEMLSALDVSFNSVAGQNRCIYMSGDFPYLLPMIVYNVETREWHWVEPAENCPLSTGPHMFCWGWTSVAYQPGFNLFVKV